MWIGAIERLYNAGIHRLGVIHRGFSSFDKKIYRNVPQWHIPIELHRRMPDIPIICDPSHIGGRRDLIAPLCQQAMDLQFDGLIIESHCDPEKAWTDAKQQVSPEVLGLILNTLVVREMNQTTETISALRKQIDEIDLNIAEVLAKRMRISREIGQYKKEHNMAILQTQRYDEIIKNRMAQGASMDMDPEFMKVIYEAIHSESVRQQMEVMGDTKAK